MFDNSLMKIDKDFYPVVVFNADFRKRLSESGSEKFSFVLTRNGGYAEKFETDVLPEGRDDALNFRYAERFLKSALWIAGGYKVSVKCNKTLFDGIASAYKKGGARDFDVCFFEKVYDKPFSVERVDKLPETKYERIPAGKNDKGARIGLDAGGSDVKIAAVLDGKVLFDREIVWQPKVNSDPFYHVGFINRAVDEAKSYLPRVDHIGVSSAGIFVDNETRVASLFVKVDEKDFKPVRDIYKNAAKRIDAPVTVANDGDVAAMAGAIELGLTNVLGLAMGTSEAVGYVNEDNCLTGRLSELAFVPVDMNESAAIDEWSGDAGVGVKYLSQDGVIKLAEKAGISLKNGKTPAEKLKIVQKLAEEGDEKAIDVFRDVGVYLAYSLLYYREFYNFKNVLLMGRVMSGVGGETVIESAKAAIESEECCGKFGLLLPDEKSRRLGQAVAASYLG